jgi:hypothetical protein
MDLRAIATHKDTSFLAPHDSVAVRIYSHHNAISKIKNPSAILSEYESKGLYLTHNRLGVTYIYTSILSNITEYRYTIDGEIVGYVEIVLTLL